MLVKQRIKALLPRSLLGRSLLILVTPILLTQIIITYVFFDSHWNKMTARLAFSVAGEISWIAEMIENEAMNFEDLALEARENLEVLLDFESGQSLEDEPPVIYGAFRHYDIEHSLSLALSGVLHRPFQVNPSILQGKWVEVAVQLPEGLLRVSIPQRRLFSSSVYVLLRWMIAVSIILSLVAILFMRNQIRPIRRLAIVAERFGRGIDAPAKFKPEGAREVRQAGAAFLDMQERIKRQIQQRTAMLAGISHDLRTPLTRMNLSLALMGEGDDVQDLKKDIHDMERMIESYLSFVRGDGGEEAELRDIDVAISESVSGFKRGGYDVSYSGEENVLLNIRPVAFSRCMENLIQNGCKYGQSVEVSMRSFKKNKNYFVEIIVDDNGEGIPKEQREDVFRPFFRIEESRNQETGGVGLGLPIAQDIIHLHGGEIFLEDRGEGRNGLRVRIVLPV